MVDEVWMLEKIFYLYKPATNRLQYLEVTSFESMQLILLQSFPDPAERWVGDA